MKKRPFHCIELSRPEKQCNKISSKKPGILVQLGFGVLIQVVLAGGIQEAFGWGTYGHQQIQRVALELVLEQMKGDPIQGCFSKNANNFLRLAVTPDYDWKSGLPRPDLTPEDEKARKKAGQFENPLHFFDADAFTKSLTVAQLPSGLYETSAPQYQKLLAENMAFVQGVDPKRSFQNPAAPTLSEVAALGTAPWRIFQLYELGVGALREGKFNRALLYLGTMGHYIGDLGQPLHVTLDYDGAGYSSPAAGAHQAFETTMLEIAAAEQGSKQGQKSKVWKSFDATQDQTKKAAVDFLSENGDRLSSIQGASWIAELLNLAQLSHSYVDPLLQAYSLSCALYQKPDPSSLDKPKSSTSNSKKRKKRVSSLDPRSSICLNQGEGKVKVPKSVVRAFMNRELQGSTLKVLTVAENQMGVSAALLSRIWLSAYREAGLTKKPKCYRVPFDQLGVFKRYPKPTYLQGSMEGSQEGPQKASKVFSKKNQRNGTAGN